VTNERERERQRGRKTYFENVGLFVAESFVEIL